MEFQMPNVYLHWFGNSDSAIFSVTEWLLRNDNPMILMKYRIIFIAVLIKIVIKQIKNNHLFTLPS